MTEIIRARASDWRALIIEQKAGLAAGLVAMIAVVALASIALVWLL